MATTRLRPPFLAWYKASSAAEIIRVVVAPGADGFMVVKKPTYGGDYKMLFFNSDGSMGEMCGNGARCICRYGYENGLAGEVQKVETTAGLVTGWRVVRRKSSVPPRTNHGTGNRVGAT